MIHPIQVYHRLHDAASGRAAAGGAPCFQWTPSAFCLRTCLREIHLVDEAGWVVGDTSDFDIYQGPEAYQFLLEVLSGLHSRVFGESEVFSQFRQSVLEYREGGWSASGVILRVLEWLLSDVKKLRRNHLEGIRLPSYGAELRRRLEPGQPVHLVGSGQLAASLYPAIADCAVTVYSRRASNRVFFAKTFPGAQVRPVENLGEAENLPGALIVASDLEGGSGRVIRLLRDNRFDAVFDLREDSAGQLITGSSCPHLTLHDFFRLFDAHGEAIKSCRQAVRREAARLTANRSSFQQIRPYGWEDLCV